MGDAKNGTVSLLWADHPKAFLDNIWAFFLQKHKVDVELTYEGERIQAHRLVLAIFSSTLREKLEASGQPPLWHLDLDQMTAQRAAGRGTDFGQLLEFIYRGKVDVGSDRLQPLKELAQALGIQGLVDAIHRQEASCCLPPTNVSRVAPRRRVLGRGAGKRKGRPVKITQIGDQRQEEDEEDAVLRRTNAPRAAKDASRSLCLDQLDEEDDDGGGGDPEPAVDDDPDDVGSPEPAVDEDDDDDDDDENCDGRREASIPSSDVPRKGRTRKNRSLKLGPNVSRSEYKRLWRQSQPFVKCPHCPYETRDKESLKKHSAKHDPNAQRYPCEVCGKSFRNKAGLRCHLRLHGDPDQLHKCAHCPFQTPKKSSWVQHLAVIHRLDPQGNELLRNVACPECNYTCVNDYQLKAHLMWKHTIDKPHKCPECPYAAVIKRDVDKHVRIKHKKERPYMCETCGFRSQTQGGHNRHVRSHSGIKPFKCELCGQAYADSSKLKIHRQKHTGDDKPFVCHLCGHACRRMDNLQMHLKRIHKTDTAAAIPTPTKPHCGPPGHSNVVVVAAANSVAPTFSSMPTTTTAVAALSTPPSRGGPPDPPGVVLANLAVPTFSTTPALDSFPH